MTQTTAEPTVLKAEMPFLFGGNGLVVTVRDLSPKEEEDLRARFNAQFPDKIGQASKQLHERLTDWHSNARPEDRRYNTARVDAPATNVVYGGKHGLDIEPYSILDGVPVGRELEIGTILNGVLASWVLNELITVLGTSDN